MKFKNVLIAALLLFSCITSAQDTIYTNVISEKEHHPGKQEIFRVASHDSVSNKRVVNDYAVTRLQKSKLKTKKGESILPEKGDWAISIDASPFLKYLGNLIGSNGLNAAPTFDFLSGNHTLLGKYFIEPQKAYRLGLRLGFVSNSVTTKVSTFPSSAPIVFVDDVTKVYTTNIGLTAGMEWRKGHTRLQGFYGFEGGLATGSSNINRTYGKNLTPNNPSSREIENKSGASFSFGGRGFIGAEYFIFPKMALGGEFGWGIAVRNVGEGSATYQYWDTATNTVNTTIIPSGGSTTFGFDSENLNSIFGTAGTIRLTLHF